MPERPFQNSASSTEQNFSPTQQLREESKQPTAVASSANNHLLFLDGLRALAAIYVVMHHIIGQLLTPSGTLYTVYSKVFSKGHFAVDVFIVLSGFCLMLPVARWNKYEVEAGAFYKKRIRRILPTYYLAMLFSLILIYTLIGTPSGTHWDVSIPVTKWDFFTHLLLIQDVFNYTNAKINHAFWSISVEFRIYFLFPLFVYLFRKNSALLVTTAVVVLSALTWLIVKRIPVLNSQPHGINPHYIGLFVMGMLSAHIAFNQAAVYQKISNRYLGIICFLGFALAFVLDSTRVNYWLMADISMAIAACCLLIILVKGKPIIVHQFFSWKPLAFAGTFAYSIYLIHAPLLEVFSRYFINLHSFSTTASILLFVAIAVPLILFISYLFFLVAEKPFIRKRAK